MSAERNQSFLTLASLREILLASLREILPAFRRDRWQSRCLNHRPEFADNVAQSVGDLSEGTVLDGVQ
jgi:hypothetical protein